MAVRARAFQQLAAPNHTVWVMPNIVDNKPAYEFTAEQKARMSKGDMRPLGEVQAQAFEKLNEEKMYGLGAISVSGYSQGGLTALALGATNSNLRIERINADEAPSVDDRTAEQLSKDFMKSGGPLELRRAIKAAGINALSQSMNMRRLGIDLARFVKNSKTPYGQLLNEAMTGSADYLVSRAVDKGVAVKLGYVAGSRLFDPKSIITVSGGLEIVRYEGKEFANRHATGDNVKLHALMADQGLRR
jgi:hypothetical protein